MQVIMRHLPYLHFEMRKVSHDTLLVMTLNTILDDLLLNILFTNVCMFCLIFTRFCKYIYICMYTNFNRNWFVTHRVLNKHKEWSIIHT